MKAILYFKNGAKEIVDLLSTPKRNERETQKEYEKRIVDAFNENQPKMVNKVVGIHLMRN